MSTRLLLASLLSAALSVAVVMTAAFLDDWEARDALRRLADRQRELDAQLRDRDVDHTENAENSRARDRDELADRRGDRGGPERNGATLFPEQNDAEGVRHAE